MPGMLSNVFADGGDTSQSTDIVANLDVDVAVHAETSYEASWSDGEGGTTTYSGGQDVNADIGVDALLAATSDDGLAYDVDGG